MKKILLISLLCPIILFGQDFNNNISQSNDIIANFAQLSSQQLYDTANYYLTKNSYDTASICFNLFINTIPTNADLEQQKKLLKVYNRLARIYFYISDYRMAYDLSIKTLLLCEKYNLVSEKAVTYTNIGVVYSYLNQFDIAQRYCLQALDLCNHSLELIPRLNNMSANALAVGQTDSALYYINKAISISKQNNDIYSEAILGTLASYHKHIKQYDSAFYYYKVALYNSKKNNHIIIEAKNLSEIGKLFFEVNMIDSAQHYIELSNKIALENKFIGILKDNYLTLSEIERSKGRFEKALNHYTTYTNLKDSIYHAGVFGSINLLQRQYEISKTNQQIEELELDRQLKENTIRYQKIIILVIMLLFIVLFVIFLQYNRIRKKNKMLVEKSVEIIRIEKKVSEKKQENNKTIGECDEVINNILKIMEDTAIYCDPSLTLAKFATLVQSHPNNVSQVIKNRFNKNFNSFVNDHRIKEAQRIFIEIGIEKITIESVSEMVGFKSRSVFYDAFKEITGVSPKYYIKSMQGE